MSESEHEHYLDMEGICACGHDGWRRTGPERAWACSCRSPALDGRHQAGCRFVSRYDVDALPLTQLLVMEVLAARYRLGENLWPFPNRAKKALDTLDSLGLVGHKGGIVEGTRNAWLTDYGKASVLSDTYVPPSASGE